MKSIILIALLSICLASIWEEMEGSKGGDELPINRLSYKDDRLIKICNIMRPLLMGVQSNEYLDGK